MKRRKFTSVHKRIVAARSKWHCESCGSMLEATYEIDHIIPLHAGGADDLDNAQALCVRCHRNKTLKEETERVQRMQIRKFTMTRRPPLMCMRCEQVFSPYFEHICDDRL